MKSIPIQVTWKRILLGSGLSLIAALQTVGNMRNGSWTLIHGVLYLILTVAVAWILALTLQMPREAQARAAWRRQFRNHILFWVVIVVVMLAIFHLLISHQHLTP